MLQLKMRPLAKAGIVLGIGMGGFVDGIVLHQILQVHNMLSNVYPPDTLENVEINMVWDGIFHAFTWITTLIGIHMLWKAGSMPHAPWPKTHLWGGMAFGWGLFNLVEGVIDHHLLKVHHVLQRVDPSTQLLADVLFDISGLLLMGLGVYLISRVGARQK